MGSVMVEVNDLTMRYGERTALKGIGFEIARGSDWKAGFTDVYSQSRELAGNLQFFLDV